MGPECSTWKYKSTRMAQGHSGADSNIMSRQEATIFASLGRGRRCGDQAFFDESGGRTKKKGTAIPPNGCRAFR